MRKWILCDLVCKKKLPLTARKSAVRVASLCNVRIYSGNIVFTELGICDFDLNVAGTVEAFLGVEVLEHKKGRIARQS